MITDTEPRAVPKPPCNCGCKGDKSKLVAANVPSSPELNKRVDDQVRALLEKASQLRVNGRTLYLTLQVMVLIGVVIQLLKSLRW